LVAVAAVPSRGPMRQRGIRAGEELAVFARSAFRLSRLAMRAQCGRVPPNISLNPDAPRRACGPSVVAPVSLVC
jgi:hypothetical protein